MTFSQKAVELLPAVTSKQLSKEVISWVCTNLVLGLTARQRNYSMPGHWPLYPGEQSSPMSKEEYWNICDRIDSVVASVPAETINALEHDWPWTQAF